MTEIEILKKQVEIAKDILLKIGMMELTGLNGQNPFEMAREAAEDINNLEE